VGKADAGAMRDSLMQQLMEETADYACESGAARGAQRGAAAERDHGAKWQAGQGCEPQAGPGCEPRLCLDLEESLDELFSDSGFSSDSGLSSDSVDFDEPSSPAELSSAVGERRSAGACLSIDVQCANKPVGEGRELEALDLLLTGEVRLTADGAVPVTPSCYSALGHAAPSWPRRGAPPLELQLDAALSSCSGSEGSPHSPDWLDLYKPEVRPGATIEDDVAEEQRLLLPLLTPSDTKLCGALVDAFLPLW